MPLEEFIIRVYVCISEKLEEVLEGKKYRKITR